VDVILSVSEESLTHLFNPFAGNIDEIESDLPIVQIR